MKEYSTIRRLWWLAVLALVAAACGGQGSESTTVPSTTGSTNGVASHTTGETGESDPASSDREPSVLSVAGFGGALADLVLTHPATEAFQEEFNVEIVWTSASSSENLASILATRDNQEYDIFIGADDSHYRAGVEGVLLPIDVNIATNLADVAEPAKAPFNGFSVSHGFAMPTMFYNTAVFEENDWDPPTSWDDLFRPELCGNVTGPNMSTAALLKVWAMMGGIEKDGSNTDEAIRAGLESFSDLAGCVSNFEANPSALNERIAGTEGAWIGIVTSNRASMLMEEGFPIELVYPEGNKLATLGSISVVDGPNPEIAQHFLNLIMGPELQLALAVDGGFSPFNDTVTVPEEAFTYGLPRRELIPELANEDRDVMADNRPVYQDMFDAAFASG